MGTHWRRGPGRGPRTGALLGSLLGLTLALGWGTTTRASAPQAIACPAGQVTWLRGMAAPGSALLAHFDGVPVGGGSAGADGAWSIPLTVRERPGVYPAAVRRRADGATVASFICYVDVAVGATPTATRTAQATASAAPPRAGAAPAPSPPFGGGPGPTDTPLALGTAAPATPPSDPGPTEATEADPAPLALVAVEADERQEPGLFEYVIVENISFAPRPLGGWRLSNQETGEAYSFPAITLGAGELLVLWSGPGQDAPESGSLFWPASESRWAPGQMAVLLTPEGEAVSTLVVGSPPQAAVGEGRLRYSMMCRTRSFVHKEHL